MILKDYFCLLIRICAREFLNCDLKLYTIEGGFIYKT